MGVKAKSKARRLLPWSLFLITSCIFFLVFLGPELINRPTDFASNIDRLYIPTQVESPNSLFPDDPLPIEIRKSVTDPPFLLAVNRKRGFMADGFAILGFYAKSESRLFYHILREKCRSGGDPPLVVDVGVNFGYFFHFAAAMGCRVIGVEANPGLIPYIMTSMGVNNHFGGRMQFYSNAASDVPGELSFFQEQDWGNSAVRTEFKSDKTVKTIKIDDIVDEPVELMKVDTEGFEMSVLRSAERLISSGKVENFVMEFKHDEQKKQEKLSWLTRMADSGYEIISYEEDYFSGDLKSYNLTLINFEPWQPNNWPKWEDIWIRRSSTV